MRLPFWLLFQLRADGSFTPRAPIRVGSRRVDPGVPIPRDVPLGPFDLRLLTGRDLEVEEHGDVTTIKWSL